MKPEEHLDSIHKKISDEVMHRYFEATTPPNRERDEQREETIICAATKYDNDKYEGMRIIVGNFHGCCFLVNGHFGGDAKEIEQGFLTSKRRFVGRKEAFKIATAANQIRKKHSPTDELMSEDLYPFEVEPKPVTPPKDGTEGVGKVEVESRICKDCGGNEPLMVNGIRFGHICHKPSDLCDGCGAKKCLENGCKPSDDTKYHYDMMCHGHGKPDGTSEAKVGAVTEELAKSLPEYYESKVTLADAIVKAIIALRGP